MLGISRRDGQMSKHEMKADGALTAEALAARFLPSRLHRLFRLRPAAVTGNCTGPPGHAFHSRSPSRCSPARKYKPAPPGSPQAFGRSLADGTAPVWLKSEPVPETNDGPVTVVVGATFDEIVMDRTKDVLLEVPTNDLDLLPTVTRDAARRCRAL